MTEPTEESVRAESAPGSRPTGTRTSASSNGAQADRRRLGRAGLAQGLARPRPAAARSPPSSTRRSAASARWASPAPASAPSPPPTLLAHGTDARKRQFLRRSLTGEDSLVPAVQRARQRLRPRRRHHPRRASRTAAGSSTARRSGPPAPTTPTGACCSARTDWDVPKHQGLTYFVLDMRQPGVEVQPLRQMNGHASFNQVFFTDAEVPPEHLVGELGGGWAVATTTLMHERRGADGVGAARRRRAGRRAQRAASTTRSAPRPPPSWSPTSGIRSAPAASTWCIERAKETGKIADPVVRQEIAKLLILARSAEWTARRARAAQVAGPPAGAGRLARQARRQPRRPRRRPRPHADHRRRRHALAARTAPRTGSSPRS